MVPNRCLELHSSKYYLSILGLFLVCFCYVSRKKYMEAGNFTFACLPSLSLTSSSILLLTNFRATIFVFGIAKYTEDWQLSRNPLALQHQIGTSETSNLKDWMSTGSSAPPVWDSHCWATQTHHISQSNSHTYMYPHIHTCIHM